MGNLSTVFTCAFCGEQGDLENPTEPIKQVVVYGNLETEKDESYIFRCFKCASEKKKLVPNRSLMMKYDPEDYVSDGKEAHRLDRTKQEALSNDYQREKWGDWTP